MTNAAFERWGVSNLTDDEADALWIALAGSELGVLASKWATETRAEVD